MGTSKLISNTKLTIKTIFKEVLLTFSYSCTKWGTTDIVLLRYKHLHSKSLQREYTVIQFILYTLYNNIVYIT